VTIHENNLIFNVNFAAGHKTGFYLDQRRNRLRVRRLARDMDVLDCFCYTGGFSVNALSGGAKSVLSVDSSSDALVLCRENMALNQLPADRHTTLEGDVFHLLRKFRDEGRSFDMIILDPPVRPHGGPGEKAARGYKDINLFAFKLLRPGGLLITFSCSAAWMQGCSKRSSPGQPWMLASTRKSLNPCPRQRIIPLPCTFLRGRISRDWSACVRNIGHNKTSVIYM